MKGKRIFLVVATLTLFGNFFSAVDIPLAERFLPFGAVMGATVTVDDDGGKNHTSIQAAIDEADPGDTVRVFSGVYNENLIINKTIDLIGNGSRNTTIVGGVGDVVLIKADRVNITGFNISKAINNEGDAAIELRNVKYCRIEKNNISNSYYGIHLNRSDGNIIKNNTFYSKGKNSFPGWSHTKEIAIEGGTPLRDYQIKIEFSKDDFDYTQAEPDGADIRFTERNLTRLDYWIEKWDPAGTSVIWVNVTTAGTTEIYMHWGNAKAASESHGNSTFDLFDGFDGNSLDLTNWTEPYDDNIRGYGIEDGALVLYLGTHGKRQPWLATIWTRSKQTVPLNNRAFEGRLKCTQENARYKWGIQNSGIGLQKNGQLIWGCGGRKRYRYTDSNALIWSEGSWDGSMTPWEVWSMRSSADVRLYSDGSLKHTDNKKLSGTGPFKIIVSVGDNAGGRWGEMYIDWVRVRKYNGDEPKVVFGTARSYMHSAIYFDSSTDNTITSNEMNGTALWINGSSIQHWNTHDLDKNTVNGKDLVYWANKTSGRVSGDPGQIILANCSNVVLDGYNLSNSTAPIILGFSDGNSLVNNTLISSQYGVHIYNGNNNSVFNNTFSNNVRGIQISTGRNNTVRNNDCSGNEWGIAVFDSSGNRILGNNLSDNARGIYARSSNGDVFKDNILFNNSGSGIHALRSINIGIINNTGRNNEGGIRFIGGSGVLLRDNDLTDGSYGLYLAGTNNNTVERNNLTDNGHGIYLNSSDRTGIIDNTIFQNRENGIRSYDSDDILIKNNSCIGNSDGGIVLSDSVNGTISNNNCSKNTDGIALLKNSDGNSVRNNTVKDNDNAGIFVLSSDNNVIENNSAVGNRHGIRLDVDLSEVNMKSLFSDDFEDGGISPWGKKGAGDAGVGTHTANSGARSSYTRWGATYLTSPEFDLSSYYLATLGFWIRRGDGSFSDKPEQGEDLKVQYKDAQGEWNDLDTFSGDGVSGRIYTPSFHLPADAYHRTFQLRFYQTGGSGQDHDYWHFDDVTIRVNSGKGQGNYVHRNELVSNERGIYVTNGVRNLVERNEITSTDRNRGMYLANSFKNIVRYNRLINLSDGLLLDNSRNNTVSYNNASYNKKGGLTLLSSHFNSLDNNTLDSNVYGISASASYNNTFENNSCGSNGEHGLYLNSSNRGNVFRYNHISENRRHGAYVGKDSELNLLHHNVISRNRRHGAYVGKDSELNLLHHNVFSRNRLYGAYTASDSRNNVFHQNNFLFNNNGSVQARDEGTNNRWNDTNERGNFWSDYPSRYPSANYDGTVWNTPYRTAGGVGGSDEHPLMFVSFRDDAPPAVVTDTTWKNATTGKEFNFSANVTDNVAVVGVWVGYSYDNREFRNISLSREEKDSWWNTTRIPENASFVNYYFDVVDAGGNWLRVNGRKLGVRDDELPIFLPTPLELPTTAEVYHLKGKFKDNVDVKRVAVNYTYEGGGRGRGRHNISLRREGESEWGADLMIPEWATLMRYSFHMEDIYGNLNSTSEHNLTVYDNDPPRLVKDETRESASTGEPFDFSVIASDNVNMSGIRVVYSSDPRLVRNISMINTEGNRWDLSIKTDPRTSRMYYYFVLWDAAGNYHLTAEKSVAVRDNDLPLVIADHTPGEITTGEILSFRALISDNRRIESVAVNYTFDNVTFLSAPLNMKDPLSWHGEIVVAPYAEYVRYRYRTTDTSGNALESGTRTVAVLDNDPPRLLKTPVGKITTGDNCSLIAELGDNRDVVTASLSYFFDGEKEQKRVKEMRRGRGKGRVRGSDEWSTVIAVPEDAERMEYYLEFTDKAGNSGTAPWSGKKILDNDAPVPDAGRNIFVEKGNSVVLDASDSTDNVGIAYHVWSFEYNGHPTVLKGAAASFVFHLPGTYTVELNVTDAAGNSARDNVLLFVNDTAEKKDGPGDPDGNGGDENDDERRMSDDTDGNGTTTGEEGSILIPLLIIGVLLVLVLSTGGYLGFVLLRSGGKEDGASPEQAIQELTAEIEHDPLAPPPPPRPPEGPGISLEYDLPEDVRRRAARPYPEPLGLPGSVYTEERPALPEEEAKLKMTGETGERQKALPQVSVVSDERDIGDIADLETGDVGEMDRIPTPEVASEPGFEGGYFEDDHYDEDIYEEEYPKDDHYDEDIYEEEYSEDEDYGAALHEEEEMEPYPEPVRTMPVDEAEIGVEEPPPPDDFDGYVPEPEVAPVPSGGETGGSGRSVSYFGVKSASLFRIYETMPCSLCYGEIAEGLQAIRCSCGEISHLACGIRAGACPECGADYQELMDKASEEAILRSVEDSRQSAKRELEAVVEWDEKDDILRKLLKQVLNKEISVEEYKMLSEDVKENF